MLPNYKSDWQCYRKWLECLRHCKGSRACYVSVIAGLLLPLFSQIEWMARRACFCKSGHFIWNFRHSSSKLRSVFMAENRTIESVTRWYTRAYRCVWHKSYPSTNSYINKMCTCGVRNNVTYYYCCRIPLPYPFYSLNDSTGLNTENNKYHQRV